MNRAQVLNATHYSHSCTKCSSNELTAHVLMRASNANDILWNFVDETTVRSLFRAFHVVQVHAPHKGRTHCVPSLSPDVSSVVTMRKHGRKMTIIFKSFSLVYRLLSTRETRTNNNKNTCSNVAVSDRYFRISLVVDEKDFAKNVVDRRRFGIIEKHSTFGLKVHKVDLSRQFFEISIFRWTFFQCGSKLFYWNPTIVLLKCDFHRNLGSPTKITAPLTYSDEELSFVLLLSRDTM